MKGKHWVLIVISALLIASIWWFNSARNNTETELTALVKKGEFISEVVTSGELEAKNSVRIYGPRGVRNYRINEMKIQDLIAEGTRVKKGDYVAKLDPSQLSNSRKDVQNEYAKTESQHLQAKLDTAIELRAKRDELKNLKFGLEEKEIEVKYSEFEPPAIQRQAQINLEKAQRAYRNAQQSYILKQRQSKAKVAEVAASLAIQQTKLEKLEELMQEFTILAPEDGMLIYAKDWSGNKRKVGSTISAWSPILAELPDLSTMVSKTFINEVDISKIKKGLPVAIGIDAFPDKELKGEVTYVANVGEERKGVTGKAFEVTILLTVTDTITRPGMTTSNRIKIFTEKEALSIPLVSISSEEEMYYVFVKTGRSYEKREIKIGRSNSNEVIVSTGLSEGEEIYLQMPEGGKEAEIIPLNTSE